MAVQALTCQLVRRRCPGGLWGYTSSQFSAEATCLALLALKGSIEGKALTGYSQLLLKRQRQNGFWPAADGDSADSVWATAVAASTLSGLSDSSAATRQALKALLDVKPQETFWLWRR